MYRFYIEPSQKQGDTIEIIGEDVNHIKIPYAIGPRRDGDLPAFWADATKAKEMLHWEATHTVEDMCSSSWKYAMSH